jgi:hypothetical protein
MFWISRFLEIISTQLVNPKTTVKILKLIKGSIKLPHSMES